MPGLLRGVIKAAAAILPASFSQQSSGGFHISSLCPEKGPGHKTASVHTSNCCIKPPTLRPTLTHPDAPDFTRRHASARFERDGTVNGRLRFIWLVAPAVRCTGRFMEAKMEFPDGVRSFLHRRSAALLSEYELRHFNQISHKTEGKRKFWKAVETLILNFSYTRPAGFETYSSVRLLLHQSWVSWMGY